MEANQRQNVSADLKLGVALYYMMHGVMQFILELFQVYLKQLLSSTCTNLQVEFAQSLCQNGWVKLF
jgi:hypothetical protein